MRNGCLCLGNESAQTTAMARRPGPRAASHGWSFGAFLSRNDQAGTSLPPAVSGGRHAAGGLRPMTRKPRYRRVFVAYDHFGEAHFAVTRAGADSAAAS